MTEVGAIEYGRRRIEYQVRRTGRLKTVSLSIDPVEGVLLSAPRGTSDDRLARIVRAKAPWIIAKQKLVSEARSPTANKEFVSGETFLYLGRQYRLHVRRAADEASVKLRGGRLEVTVSPAAGSGDVRAAVIAWYRRHASDYLSGRAHSGSTGVSSRRRVPWSTTSSPTRSPTAYPLTILRGSGSSLAAFDQTSTRSAGVYLARVRILFGRGVPSFACWYPSIIFGWRREDGDGGARGGKAGAFALGVRALRPRR